MKSLVLGNCLLVFCLSLSSCAVTSETQPTARNGSVWSLESISTALLDTPGSRLPTLIALESMLATRLGCSSQLLQALPELLLDVLKTGDRAERYMASHLLGQDCFPEGEEALRRVVAVHELDADSGVLDSALEALILRQVDLVDEVVVKRIEQRRPISTAQFILLAHRPSATTGELIEQAIELGLVSEETQIGYWDSVTTTIEIYNECGVHGSAELIRDAAPELVEKRVLIGSSWEEEIYDRYKSATPFVTSDVVTRSLSLLTKVTLGDMEVVQLIPAYRSFCEGMLTASLEQRGAAIDSAEKDLCLQNAEFFAVWLALLGGDSPLARESEMVVTELQRINELDTQEWSPLLEQQIEYSNFKPRGRLSRSEEGRGYYRALIFFGVSQFRLKSQSQTDRALLMARLLAESPTLYGNWKKIDRLLTALLGEPLDLTFDDYIKASADVNPKRFLNHAASTVETEPQSGEMGRAPGLRVFAHRWTHASRILQEEVNQETWPVSGLHVCAGVDCEDAAEELTRRGFSASKSPPLAEPQNIVDRLLHSASTLFAQDSRHPRFMTTEVWQHKQLNTALAAWSELDHTFQGYLPPVNAFSLGGEELPLAGLQVYVEPVPRYYLALAREVEHWITLFDSFGAWQKINDHYASAVDTLSDKSDEDYREEDEEDDNYVTRQHWQRLHEVLLQLADVSERQLEERLLLPEQLVLLHNFHEALKWLAVDSKMCDAEFPQISVAATHSGRRECLQVGTHFPLRIVVLVERFGVEYAYSGGIYSYCEFIQPSDDILTDNEEWRSPESSVSDIPRGCFLEEWIVGEH